MNFTFGSDMYCCIKITPEGKTIKLLFSSEGYNPEDIVKPHIWEKHEHGYSMIDIRNYYTKGKVVYSWVKDNYNLLMKHWLHKITDEELIKAISERS